MNASLRRSHVKVWLVLLPLLLIGVAVGVGNGKPHLRSGSVTGKNERRQHGGVDRQDVVETGGKATPK